MKRLPPPAWLALLLLGACDDGLTSSEPPPPAPLDAELRESMTRWGALPIGPMPAQPPARVQLGRALFFDPILSGNRDVACATCHHPATSLGDGLSLSVGTGGSGLGPSRTPGPGLARVPRSSPSLLNAGLGLSYMLWDGRLRGFREHVTTEGGPPLPAMPNLLAAQALLPVLDRREMRGAPGDRDVHGRANELAGIPDGDPAGVWRALMRRLLDVPEYVDLFRAAFPGRPVGSLGFEHAAEALAAFQMEAFTKTRSPFDRYLDRDDAALTSEQKRGARLFFDRARCASCHSGPFLGGQGFANVGVPQIGPGTGAEAPLDLGLGGLNENRFYEFAFRVAPLRNVELTAPYMHSGAYATLEAVVRHYDDVPSSLRHYDASQLHPALRDLHHGDGATIQRVLSTLDHRVAVPLQLSEDEIGELVAFLRSLTDPAARDLGSLLPARVPSGLPVPR